MHKKLLFSSMYDFSPVFFPPGIMHKIIVVIQIVK